MFLSVSDIVVICGAETSPVLTCREMDVEGEPPRNIRGTVGLPLPGTRIKYDPRHACLVTTR